MTSAFRERPLLWAAIAAIIVLVVLSCFPVVPETQQAVVIRFGKPVRILNRYQPGQPIGGTGAGLSWRLPYPIEDLVRVDKRILDVDLGPLPVVSADQRPLEVDAYARYRIVDPVAMYVRARDGKQLAERLRPLLAAAVRGALQQQAYADLVSAGPQSGMASVRAALDRNVRQYGAEIVDVRIKTTALPDGPALQAAYDGMRSERQQVARSIRAAGMQQAQQIEADADSDAASIYAASFGKDPQFYDFYRAMQSYRTTFIGDPDNKPTGSTTVILSPDNDYLKQFAGPSR